MGQVFYRDWTPGATADPTYNPANALPQAESWQSYVPKTLPFQPAMLFDNRLSPADYALANEQFGGRYTLDELYQLPHAAIENFVAPAQPVRKDVFNQLAARVNNRPVAGQAPTRGIYTGVTDLAE